MSRKRNGGQPATKKQAARLARQRAARRRQFRNWLFAMLAVGAIGVFVAYSAANAPTGVTDVEGWDLPAMGPTAESQDRVTLTEFAGTPTVVNFFASWCVECDRELPGFRSVSSELDGQIDFVGIASQEPGNPLYMPERHDVDWWPLARDVGGRNLSGLSEALGARGMPLTAFYDEAGRLLDVRIGSITEAQLRGQISTLYGIDT